MLKSSCLIEKRPPTDEAFEQKRFTREGRATHVCLSVCIPWDFTQGWKTDMTGVLAGRLLSKFELEAILDAFHLFLDLVLYRLYIFVNGPQGPLYEDLGLLFVVSFVAL